jgi:FKBP-type peptidyl-prolyl cis-trans isomerase SlyD
MIKTGKVVNLAYSLTNSKGEVLDNADSKNPLTYLHGSNQLIPGLESALNGMQKGDKKQVTIQPADAYGEVNPELKLEVKRSQFPKDVEIKAGMEFETQTPDGHSMVFQIDSVDGDTVVIDANHPLAGETLHFDVEVLEVRDATEEEKSHGHAHGLGGHSH